MKRMLLCSLGLLVWMLLYPQAAFAHGVIISHEIKQTVEIKANYDSGEAMSEAQVSVFAPGDPAKPWLTGVCDEDGIYQFSPDSSKPGTWDIQVRKAGHGAMIHVEVGEGDIAVADSGVSLSQKILMAACVIWGLIGTALYFRGRKS